MDEQEQFRRMSLLFEAARSLGSSERLALLQETAAADPDLAREVRRLLDRHEEEGGALSEPIVPPPPLPTEQVELPERISRYTVKRQLGAGGMGVVYLAEQESPRREVAVKVIRPGLISPALLMRFDVEAAVLARLRHPGVAQIYEAGTYNDRSGPRPYFAMEYVEGPPLLQYAAEHSLDVRRRLELMARVCAGVHHAHQQGVIHRDLKPGNILVDATGQPKIVDFGVARAADAEPGTLRTSAGELLGTIGYMSPEQTGGDPLEVDTRTDVYALGVLLYELLAGRLPYDLDGLSLPAAIQRIQNHEPASLSSARPSLRGDLETICAAALAKDRSRRYQSASGLEADIRRYLRGDPIAARQPSTIYLLGKFARRNRALVAAALIAVFSLVGLLAATSIAAVEIARQRDEALASMREANTANEFLSDVLGSLDPRESGAATVTLGDFLEDVTARIDDGRLADQPRVEAVVRGTIGVAYRTIGLYAQSRTHLERSLALLEAHDPGNTIQITGVMGSLGALYLRAGDMDGAEPLLVGAVDRLGSMLDADHSSRHATPDTLARYADALQNLAVLRQQQRRLDESEKLIRRTLVLRRQRTPIQPGYLARSLNALAVILRQRGDVEGARAAYEEALDLHRQLGHDGDLDLASTMSNLALLHLYSGRPAEAVPLLDEALKIRLDILPQDHPLIAQTLNSLGGARQSGGDDAGAVEAYRTALALRISGLGEGHPSVATTRVNLGVLLARLDRHEDAIEQLEAAVACRRVALGPDDVRLARALVHLGRTMIDGGRFENALPILRESVAILDAAGQNHRRETTAARVVLGEGLMRASRFEEGAALLSRALQDAREQIGPEHPTTLRAMAQLGAVYCCAGRTAEAVGILERALSLHRQVLGDTSAETLQLTQDLASAYGLLGRDSDRETLLVQLLAVQREVFGDDHLNTLTTRMDITAIWFERGEHESARDAYAAIIDQLESLYADHPLSTAAHDMHRRCLLHLSQSQADIPRP